MEGGRQEGRAVGLALSWKRNLENVALLQEAVELGGRGPKVGGRGVPPEDADIRCTVCLKHRLRFTGPALRHWPASGSPEGLGCRAELPAIKDDRLSLLSQGRTDTGNQ